MLVAIVTMARCGTVLPGAAVKLGSRARPQLTLTTPLVVRQATTRSRKESGTPSWQSATVRLGSALETTTPARSSSPAASWTPSPGRMAATSTPAASTAPASAAASAMANDTRPMPPWT
jgi:hypothetical protein